MTLFVDVFADVAGRHGDAAAVIDRGRVFTYGDLWARARDIAALLHRQDIGRDNIVGLHLEKSFDYVAGVIGCWIAGAAFVPLPPVLPEERRAAILAETGAAFVFRGEAVPVAAAVPDVVRRDDDLAYVIYTSGSSGRPKGVMVEQAGLVPMLLDQIAAFGFASGKKSLFYLSTAFDASLSDIGTALLSGAALVIEDDAVLKDPAALIAAMRRHGVTHVDCPPSLLKVLDRDAMPDSLETIVIGGEVCPPDVVRRWAARFNVVNVYGPTEATICASLCRCDPETWTVPLIGRPLSDVVFHVIDGELHIETRGLARGYLAQPALTAEKFIMHDGRRLYRTGDSVRRLDNGDILFLGRIDRQFKRRGQLVEPEEIEAVLLRDPAIRAAAVIRRPLHAGMADDALVAFVETDETDTAAVLQRLSAALPAWMVPDMIRPVDVLPRTQTGKPDYAILATLPCVDAANNGVAETDMTDTERALHRVWARVLKHDSFGLDDHFLRVGGDSLRAMSMVLEAEREQLFFSPGLLMLHPTIRQLARAVDFAGRGAGDGISADILRGRAVLGAEIDALVADAVSLGGGAQAEKTGAVLLTGVTGCLGGWLAGALLRQGVEKIYCLVRANSDAAAQRRLDERMGYADPRLVALAGDVSRAGFGWPEHVWRDMAASVDVFYHCAAAVNMVASYDDLEAANVGGVREVLRFVLTGRRKSLHYASTLSVFVATDRNTGRALETDRLLDTKTVYGGYAQTKWVAETMLLAVPAAAADISCYRFGLITGDSRCGISAPHDFLSMFVTGIRRLGVVPPLQSLAGMAVDVTPIDAASAGMAALSMTAPSGIYHLANRDSLDLVRLIALLRAAGVALAEVPLETWQSLPQHRAMDVAETSAWMSLCRVLPVPDFERLRGMDLFQATGISFDMSRSGFSCPPPSDALVSRYIRHMLASGMTARRVYILGPESTGKSTLARRLADHFGVACVPEYAESYLRDREGRITYDDIPAIAAGQVAAEDDAVLAQQDGIVICDSNAVTTVVWSEYLFGDCPPWVRRLAASRDGTLYLICDIDVPWVDDVHRYAPDARAAFMQAFEDELTRHGWPYLRLSGGWDDRFAAACAAIERIAS